MVMEVMRSCVTYGVGHDSQVPQVLAVNILEEVVEAVRATVGARVPAGGVPDAVEEGEGEGLVEDDEGVAGLPEGIEEGDLPGRDRECVGVYRGRGHPDGGRARVGLRLRLALSETPDATARREPGSSAQAG